MQRLKTRPQFQATLSGATVARTPHFALHRLPLATPQEASEPVPGLGRVPVALIAPGAVWLGAMVPKRWARRAVTRNAIKRQIYGVAAVFESRLPAAAHVVRLRSTFDRQQFVSACSAPLKLAVREELHALFERSLRSPL
ncbi:MAG: ribonuclease P protein component [Giesbergeria sp.]|jgi:ribonuclease P protein component|nr:ribonuclease P protein component [Giesbergeria sp.]MBP6159631.1 ribonuclease P protein component [Giesbergeria sp.]MBP7084363.1 ribonuclease P protein component [Giesbergeria sp.]MBP9783678.1 ribonuclease P protein component [Giesbergeria sp.]MBP9894378.1 ribonuclease P protein component [Giesbergeria sp.]